MAVKIKKKTKIRQRILTAFSCVLFFSFLLTGIIFNIAMSTFSTTFEHYYVAEYLVEQQITGRAGLTLFVLIGVMFVMAEIAAYFLANSITRPIEKLGVFAKGMGSGNFAANDFEFNDIELENLNAALNKSVKQLEAYDSRQKTFFQNASHELRTPLMSIKCYAEGISYGIMDAKQASETILQETDRLTELVSDLLFIAKIDNISTPYTVEELDLVALIKDRAHRQEALASKNNIRFTFDFGEDSLSYECTEELISRAFDNLISNAVRYAKSEITISLHKDANNVIITIADDGDGIEADALPYIFERFYKGRGGNTGIGLAIVKSIVDQHRGHIEGANGNGGAVFTITLPN